LVGVASVVLAVRLLVVDDVITSVAFVAKPVSVSFSLTLCLQDENKQTNKEKLKKISRLSAYVICSHSPNYTLYVQP